MDDPYAQPTNRQADASGSGDGGLGNERKAYILGKESKALTHLTQKEAQALMKVQSTVATTRRIGFLTGACLSFLAVRRRKPPLKTVASAAFIAMGGFVGGVLGVPAGAVLGRRHLGEIEDMGHFVGVLQGAAQERRSGGIPSPTPPPPPVGATPRRTAPGGFGADGSGGGGGGGGFSGPWGQGSTGGGGDSEFARDASNVTLAGSIGADGGFVPNATSSPSAADGWGSSAPSTSAAYPSSPPQAGGAGQPTTTRSRWAELRGQRAAPNSSWERVRQESGVVPTEGAAHVVGPGGGSVGGGSVDGSAGGVGSTWGGRGGGGGAAGGFGLGGFGGGGGGGDAFGEEQRDNESERERFRREYEASFDRERRGLD